MKRLFTIFLVLITIYVIYFDLNHGTLTSPQEPVIEVAGAPNQSIPAFQQKVKTGDTVLLIVERELHKNLPVSIDQLIADFKKLNDNLSPEDIQVGKIYHFPDYQQVP
ncbi:hypothetical protein [Niallia sp. 01092]|uniref:hypothetical protein n=1 Tax=unclassified Niallia TaxID=2837522 RepID=UPI003FCFC851